MDLTNINTISDLINENEKNTPVEDVLDKIFELEPADGLIICKRIVASLAKWHEDVAESGDVPSSVWHIDLGKLEVVFNILKSIEC